MEIHSRKQVTIPTIGSACGNFTCKVLMPGGVLIVVSYIVLPGVTPKGHCASAVWWKNSCMSIIRPPVVKNLA